MSNKTELKGTQRIRIITRRITKLKKSKKREKKERERKVRERFIVVEVLPSVDPLVVDGGPWLLHVQVEPIRQYCFVSFYNNY